jgi:hypothetical protein
MRGRDSKIARTGFLTHYIEPSFTNDSGGNMKLDITSIPRTSHPMIFARHFNLYNSATMTPISSSLSTTDPAVTCLRVDLNDSNLALDTILRVNLLLDGPFGGTEHGRNYLILSFDPSASP